MTQLRKLAAIMFTDIVGYSAIMSKDEKQALNILGKNREIHKSAIHKFNGKFIKEIGDGTLSIFQTSSDAVNCAIVIQKECCRESMFSVRIGIHIGEIVVMENDVFGDGVNIASRIEAAGEPGGIYISERVYEDIKNKTDINAEFIGEKKLKNINHPVKVYVLQQGSQTTLQVTHIPSGSSWLKKRKYPVIIIGIFVVFAILFIIYLVKSKDYLNLDENLITVAIFENQTGDKSLDPVGRMASDWITQGIANTGLVSVIPSVALKTIDNIHQNMDGIRTLAKKTNAKTIITGVFYKQGNNIQFHTHIVDAGESRIISIVGPVSGQADNPLNPIEILRQKVMGALAANFDRSFRIFSDRKLNPPLFEAYQEFLKGQELYYDHEYVDANQHFFKAATIDTSYLLPIIWAFASSMNITEYEKADSLHYILEESQNRFTPGEKYLLDYVDAWYIDRDWEAVYNATQKVVKYNLLFKYEQGRSALFTNRLEEAIEKSLTAGPDTILFKAMYWEVLTEAYHLMGNYSEELKEAQAGRDVYPELFISLWNELRALAALGRMEEIEEKFNESLNLRMKIRDNAGWTPGRLMTRTALELRAHGFAEESKLTIEWAIEWFTSQMGTEHRFGLARSYYVAGKWEKSSKLFKALLAENPDWDENNKYLEGIEGTSRGWSSYNMVEYIGYLGGIAAHQDIYEEAEQFAKQLAVAESPDLYGLHFCWQARIAAISGNKEKSLQLLRDALADGYLIKDLHADMDLESMRSYPPFQELIKPRR